MFNTREMTDVEFNNLVNEVKTQPLSQFAIFLRELSEHTIFCNGIPIPKCAAWCAGCKNYSLLIKGAYIDTKRIKAVKMSSENVKYTNFIYKKDE